MQKLDLKVNAEVGSIMALISSVAPSAVLAGGYLRDLATGVTPKDLDVFVSEEDYFAATDYLYREGYHCTKHLNSGYVCLPAEVDAISDFTHPDPSLIPVNLVGLRGNLTMDQHVARFDFGICQIGYRNGEVFVTDAFMQDLQEQTFTLTREGEASREFSMKRWERISPRFPGWTLVVPEIEATF